MVWLFGWIPRKVKEVEGPYTFESFMGALILSHKIADFFGTLVKLQ